MNQYQEEEIFQAFHLMWDNYPESVRLIDKSFTVLAGNKVYQSRSGKTGIKCNTGNPELHRGCQAMNALKSGETRRHQTVVEGVDWDSYWIPVDGTDYYVHFTNGINETIARRKAAGEK